MDVAVSPTVYRLVNHVVVGEDADGHPDEAPKEFQGGPVGVVEHGCVIIAADEVCGNKRAQQDEEGEQKRRDGGDDNYNSSTQ